MSPEDTGSLHIETWIRTEQLQTTWDILSNKLGKLKQWSYIYNKPLNCVSESALVQGGVMNRLVVNQARTNTMMSFTFL